METYSQIVHLENLLLAWKEFRRGKRLKLDVAAFEFALEDNLFLLHEELINKQYVHQPYASFYINDPKRRHIHKAAVRDRVVHQALFRLLYPQFEKRFIFDSYSCRIAKGTHRAVRRLEQFTRTASENNRRPLFALKCDVTKFFDSIDHAILFSLIERHVTNKDILWLIERIVKSHNSADGKGLPLGNVTSQLFANIYLDPLDQFMKRTLRVAYYLRYCDDFVILHNNPEYLFHLVTQVKKFLKEILALRIHEDKIILRKYTQGIDFLGYVILPHFRVLRTKTKKRMLNTLRRKDRERHAGKISDDSFGQSMQSYLGVLKHCKSFKIKQVIIKDTAKR